MAAHLIVVKIFQSGPKRWTSWQTDSFVQFLGDMMLAKLKHEPTLIGLSNNTEFTDTNISPQNNGCTKSLFSSTPCWIIWNSTAPEAQCNMSVYVCVTPGWWRLKWDITACCWHAVRANTLPLETSVHTTVPHSAKVKRHEVTPLHSASEQNRTTPRDSFWRMGCFH